jgi:hypothetical protein
VLINKALCEVLSSIKIFIKTKTFIIMEKYYNNHLSNPYLKALVRLSAFLAVLLLVGINTSSAQWGETVNVSNEKELIEAMDNMRVEVIILAPGYYGYLDIDAYGDTKIFKAEKKQTEECTYYVTSRKTCFNTPLQLTAGTIEIVGGTCPPPDSGHWDFPASMATVEPVEPDGIYDQYDLYVVTVDYPGSHAFGYIWDDQSSAYTDHVWHATPDIDDPNDVVACDSYTLPELTIGGDYFASPNGVGPIAVGTEITSTQVIYVYAESGTAPNCTVENSFTVTIYDTPVINDPADVVACDSYTLPPLTIGGEYFSSPGGVGQIAVGTEITSTQVVYVYAENALYPACNIQNSFAVTIYDTAEIDDPEDVFACDGYILPPLEIGGGYFASPGGVDPIDVGTEITSTQLIYVYAESDTDPVCWAENEFTVTIYETPDIDAPGNESSCESYILPALSIGGGYFASPGGVDPIAVGTEITSTQIIYVYAESGTVPNCWAENEFTVTIYDTPDIDDPEDVFACDSYILPELSIGGGYFASPGGLDPIDVGTEITSTQIIYVYEESSTAPICWAENEFTVTIYETPDIDAPVNVFACESYILPELLIGGGYFASPGGVNPIAAGTEITSTQLIYVYAESGTVPNCWAENEFTVTIYDTPNINNPADVFACNSYTLPELSIGGAYFASPGGVNPIAVGTVITSTQLIYVYAESGTAPNCWAENEFTVTIYDTPDIDDPADVFACDSYTLPELSIGGAYFAFSGGVAPIAAGTEITSTQLIYVYAESDTSPNCWAENEFTVTIYDTPDIDDPEDVFACDSYTLPTLFVGGGYFASPGGVSPIPAGTEITSTQDVYVYAESDTSPNCWAENEFTVTIYDTPDIDDPEDVFACDSYTLPTLYIGGGYFASPGGADPIDVGAEITSTQVVYVYADNALYPQCAAQNSFTVTIYDTPEIDNPTNVVACDSYILPALSIGGAYFASSGGVDPIAVGTEITSTQVVYVYAENALYPDCNIENIFTVTIYDTPEIDNPNNVVACDSYTLPALLVGGGYFASPGGVDPITVGSHITSTQLIYVYAENADNPDCNIENSFTVTIYDTPVINNPADVVACDSYILPELSIGGEYFASSGGVGPIAVGTEITSTQVVYVYAENALYPDCNIENSFTVTIYDTPVINDPADVVACDSYMLPALSIGGEYFSSTGGVGPIAVGTEITSSQVVYVYAENADYPQCNIENSFLVTINYSPFVSCDDILVCLTDEAFSLDLHTYTDGVNLGYTGAGVVGDMFHPDIAGIGNHEITFTAENDGCFSTCTFIVTVYPDPDPEITGPDPVYSGSTEDYFVEASVLEGFDGLFDVHSWNVVGTGIVDFTDDDMTITVDCGSDAVTLSVDVICGGTISFDWAWLNPGAGDVNFAIEVDGVIVDAFEGLSGSVSFDVGEGQTVAFVGSSTECDMIMFEMSNFNFEVNEEYIWWVSGITPDYSGHNPANNPVIVNEDDGEVIVNVPWPFVGTYELWVEASNCAGCEGVAHKTITVLPNRFAGQVKYYNQHEDPMPSPFETNHDGMFVPDYFYVSLVDATFDNEESHPYYDAVEAVKVKEFYGYTEDNAVFAAHYANYPYNITYAAAFAFEYNLNPAVEYAVLVWDGGYFDEFNNGDWVEDGTVGVLGKSWTWFNWNPLGSNAVNATDALLINHMVVNNPVNTYPNMKHIVPPNYNDGNALYGSGVPGWYAANFNISVADVNASVLVNPGQPITALDALLTSRRAIGAFEKFPNNKPNFSVSGIFVDGVDFNINHIFGDLDKPYPSYFFYQGNDNYNWSTLAKEHYYKQDLHEIVGWQPEGMRYLNIYYNSVGDINSSYRPLYGGWKNDDGLQLHVKGVMDVNVGDEIAIPVSINNYAHLGAISLGIDYRNDLVEITGTSFGDDAHFDNDTGSLRVAWASLDGEHYEAGSDIAYIMVRLLDHVDPETELFTLNAFTELADTKAMVLPEIDLSTIALNTGALSATDIAEGMISVVNFPNPFDKTTTIRYELPENAEVQMIVYNKMGQIVKTLVDEDQTAGVYEITLRSSDLVGPGIYHYRLLVNGVYNKYSATNSMMLIK